MIIDYTTAEDDKTIESRGFGNSHALLIDETVSKITISPKTGNSFKVIAARIYSTQIQTEIPMLTDSLVRPVFKISKLV